MQTDSYANLTTLVKGLTGNTTFTTEEDALIASFVNRRIYHAYRRSAYWPRYLVLNEARAVSDGVVSFTQVALNPIDSFIHINKELDQSGQGYLPCEFYVNAGGANILQDIGTTDTVYVDYKKRWGGSYNSTTNSDIPLEFFHYAAHASVADFLRYDKQHDKAAQEEAFAESLLVLELESAMRQRNVNIAGVRVRTHASQQNR